MTEQIHQPSEAPRRLDLITATSRVSGGAEGTVTYAWMEGGFFLIQHVDMDHDGRQLRGMEIIGHNRPFAAEPSADIMSRFHDSEGNTLDHVHEIEGDTLTIWGGERGSPAYDRGRFNADGDTVDGAPVCPGGGGYDSTMTRIT
jgi:hypothetical protein